LSLLDRRTGQAITTSPQKYRRIAARRGPTRALVAVVHSILTSVWHMLTTGEVYRDPRPDFAECQPARTRARAVKQIEELGYTVSLEPLTHTG